MNTDTKIICLIYTANMSKDAINVISDDKDSLSLPQIDISALNPKKDNIALLDIVETIFERSVNLNFKWAKPRMINLELSYDDQMNKITTAIYYGIYVPENVQLNNCHWVDIKPYVPYYETLRKLICML